VSEGLVGLGMVAVMWSSRRTAGDHNVERSALMRYALDIIVATRWFILDEFPKYFRR
jgi:hypothetical protein